ncbi:hypothetical protein M8998_12815 [Sphingobacterium sp. lm-10]|uniref:hypothetical protein n=1 Tax=Sphingobacterium sp. lm-10 TaxID=2944904 RepID=UPI002021EA3D|nr:hypothetical protein [Sphingobacterium sp. lm-10]MCL7988824.1 hypothetical protein [Sphingobacterium sp. lm-10]
MRLVSKIYVLLALFVVLGCGQNAPLIEEREPDPTPMEQAGISGNLSAITLRAGATYTVVGDLQVPEGQVVTIPAGVTFEFNLGPRNEAWVLDVHGSLYVKGTENNRVVFTASRTALASARNTGYGGLWGGIHAGRKAGDLVIEHADVLHAGGIAREGTIITTPESGGSGRLGAGDRGYGLWYCRPVDERQDGVFILLYSHIAYTLDDAIRTNGGRTLLAYNTFEVIGLNGGEAVNIKAGAPGDYAFNLFFNIATNSLKSADTQAGVRGILETNFYNNTIVNSGYRRAEEARGGSLNYESDAYGKAYNNLIVNSRYGLRLTPGEGTPRVTSMQFGYNWHYGTDRNITDNFYPTGANNPSNGLIGSTLPIPTTDVIGAPNENDPGFVNYRVSTFTWAGRSNNSAIPNGANFHLTANSPALTGAKTDFEPKFATYTTLQGDAYAAPRPAAYFGAFGRE